MNSWYDLSMSIPFIIFLIIGCDIYFERHKEVKFLIIFNFIYIIIMRIFVWR